MRILILAIAALLQASVVKSSICKLAVRPKHPEVPENLEEWRRPYEDYEPVEWNEECTEASCDPETPVGLKFNKKLQEVDRRRARTCFKRPKVNVTSDGYPLNPAGRTGIKGRGMLNRWGPNHLVKVVLMSGKGNETKLLMRQLANTTEIPENFVDTLDGPWYDTNTEEKLVTYLTNTTGSEEKARKLIASVQKKSKQILSGSFPSVLNTDHAWVELHIKVIECKQSKDYCDAVADALSEEGFRWIATNETTADAIAKKPESVGEDPMAENELKRYGAFCTIRRKKYLKKLVAVGTLAAVPTGLTVGIFIFGAVLGAILGGLLIATVPLIVAIPLIVVLAIGIRRYRKCH